MQQSEVIVQLPEETDISVIIGEHRWSVFLEHQNGSNGRHPVSLILEYNYRQHGEPSNRASLNKLLISRLRFIVEKINGMNTTRPLNSPLQRSSKLLL